MNANSSSKTGSGSRVARFVANLCLGAIILAAAGFIVPSLMGYERYVIVGGSMSGSIERGSVAFEKLTPVEDLAVGDIITYQPPVESGLTTLVTHRIVKVKQTREGQHLFRTKGDANDQADPWQFILPKGQQPRVEFTVPLAGHAFMAIADRETRMLLVGVPAGLVCLLGLLDLARMAYGARRPAARPTLQTQEA